MSGGPVAYVNDRRNIHFMLYQVLNLDKTLAAHYPEHSVSSIEDIFNTVERVAVDHFLPHNQFSDKHEALYDAANETSVIIPDVKKGLDAYYATGLGGSNFPSDVGGLNLPPVVHFALLMPLYAANCSTCSYPLLTSAAANLMLHHCDAKQINKYVPRMVTGQFFGTMNLSEPQAGSSLADIATKAVRIQGDNPDQAYSISGSKMWITGAGGGLFVSSWLTCQDLVFSAVTLTDSPLNGMCIDRA
jgi:alkylation response protein AidB-like acyl-CoA dehydrogenase